MLIQLKLDRKKTYIAGVSGGPDSMALVQLLRTQGYSFAIAHVNYHARPTCMRDQEIVQEYARQYQIPFEHYDAHYPGKGNFEAWAREIRYDFFGRCARQYKADGVILGHNQDDLIETYLMQCQKDSGYSYYGLREQGRVGPIMVYRPLLDIPKQQLKEYCDQNNVPYGIDETNADMTITRNRFRTQCVQYLDTSQRNAIVEEIRERNESIRCQQETLHDLFSIMEPFDAAAYQALPADRQAALLREWLMTKQIDRAYHMSDGYAREIGRKLCAGKNERIQFGAQWQLDLDYGKISLHHPAEKYVVNLTECRVGSWPWFSLRSEGSRIEGMHISEDDFPIQIRNAQEGDTIQLRFGHKRISRWFIDRHIPRYQREMWPVVVNRNGDILFASGIGCSVSAYQLPLNLYLRRVDDGI